VLTAVLERPDMPRSMFGIPGMNPWNIAFLFVIIAWLFKRNSEGLKWDLPRGILPLLFTYAAVIVVSYIRLSGDFSGVAEYHIIRGFPAPSSSSLFSDLIINSLKWMIPGLLIFHGCNSKERLNFAVLCIVLTYTILALQVIKWMPLSSVVSGEGLAERSLRVLDRETGYHRVDLSMILAGASWGIFSVKTLFFSKRNRAIVLVLAAIALFGQALTGGRTGYGAWVVIGLVLSWMKWKKLLLFIPVVTIVIAISLPSVTERLSEGFSSEDASKSTPRIEYLQDSDQDIDYYAVTAGRLLAWPFVIEKIKDAPFFGYGREAMQNIGISKSIYEEFRDSFPHPHNAYLQLILDNGILGAIPVFLFYFIIVKFSIRLFKDSSNRVFVAIGGLCLSTVLSLLIASVGAQSFYPKVGVVGMWCSIGLMLRLYVERKKVNELSNAEVKGSGETWIDAYEEDEASKNEIVPEKRKFY
jgi:O-antigen ligase